MTLLLSSILLRQLPAFKAKLSQIANCVTVILGLKVHLAFGKTLEADLTEVLVRSVANPRALLTLAFRSLSNSFAS